MVILLLKKSCKDHADNQTTEEKVNAYLT